MLENMLQFLEMFHTEEQCFQYLEEMRWGDNFQCSKCGEKKYWRAKRGYRICFGCRKHLRVTAGTVLHGEKVQLRTVFLIAWYMVTSKQGVSVQELASTLQMNLKTVWTWQHKLRRAMVLPDRKRLTKDVEVDEVFIGGAQSGKRGRGATGKQKVIIAVEVNKKTPNKKGQIRGMGRVRMSVIPNCSHITLKKFILENIEVGSTLYTDDWKGYCGMEKYGFTRIIEKEKTMSDNVEGIDTIEVTPNVHIIASLVKRWLLGTHQKYLAKHGYLQSYLDEYTFRYNRRKSSNRAKLFKTIMEQVINTSPTTYADIKKKLV